MLHIVIGTRAEVKNKLRRMERRTGTRLDYMGMRLEDGTWAMIAKERKKDSHTRQRVAVSHGMMGSIEEKPSDGIV